MKRLFAILLSLIILCGAVPASALIPAMQAHVATNTVPKEATEHAREYFAECVLAGDICEWTDYTLDVAKTARLAPGFATVIYNIPGATEAYYFPILVGERCALSLLVFKNSETGTYIVQMPEFTFNAALNDQRSAPDEPITFFMGDQGVYLRDYKGAVTIIERFFGAQDKMIEAQIKAIAKLPRPANVIETGINNVYPERLQSQLTLIDDGAPELVVKDYKNGWKYVSPDGGKTWKNNAVPPMYVSIPATSFPRKDGKIPYTVHNNTKEEGGAGHEFTLYKWDGQKWSRMLWPENHMFPMSSFIIEPNSKRELTAQWSWKDHTGLNTPAGRYKFVRSVGAGGLELICEVEFTLV